MDLLPTTTQKRRSKQETDAVNLSLNRKIRLAIQELGPTFVKFGQIMSTRRDLLSPELIEELKQLTDKVAPVPFEKVRPTIEEYCGTIQDTFEYINKRPFAAASLSQAHHAKLKDGDLVVLKVQRPGIKPVIENDLIILKEIAERAEKTNSDLQIFNFPAMVEDFGHQIMAELDFVQDGKNADLLASNMRDLEDVLVPKIFWKYSGQRMLVMEYMKGVRVDRVEQIKKMGVDPKTIALIGFRAYMNQIFNDGFFHGDPHPGNLRVTRGGKLIFLDFGLVGIIRPEKRDLLMKMLLSFMNGDVDGVVDAFSDLGIRVQEQWADAFKDDIYRVLMASASYNPNQPNSGSLDGVVEALRRYNIRVPSVTMLMIKVLMMVSDDASKLYPEFDFNKEVKTILSDLKSRRLEGALNQANISMAGFDLIDAFKDAKDLPNNVNLALKQVQSGSFTFKFAQDDIDSLGNIVDRASYKIFLGMISASLVIGMSLIILSSRTILTTVDSLQIAIIVYATTVVLGLFSVIQLIRGRDKHSHMQAS